MLQNRNSYLEPGIKAIIMLNVLIWLFDYTNFSKQLFAFDMQDLFGLHYWESDNFKPWQLVSYMFLHDRTSLTHIFFNMFNLWMFGNLMEQKWGTQRFLLFYFVCGIGGSLVQEAVWSFMYAGKTTAELSAMLFTAGDITNGGLQTQFNIGLPNGSTMHIDSINALRAFICQCLTPVTVGASAGAFGVMVAFAMTFPNIPLYFFFIPIPIKAKYMIGAFVAIELIDAIFRSGIWGSHGLAVDNVAHIAHLGGIVFGALLILWWRKTGEDSGPMY